MKTTCVAYWYRDENGENCGVIEEVVGTPEQAVKTVINRLEGLETTAVSRVTALSTKRSMQELLVELEKQLTELMQNQKTKQVLNRIWRLESNIQGLQDAIQRFQRKPPVPRV